MKGNLTHDIQNLLLDIGIPTNQLGFLYLVYGMQLVMENYEYIARVYKLLYVEVAAKYQTEPQSVERCIRHAIGIAFSHKENKYIADMFSSYNKVPSNSQFLSSVYFLLINEK